MIEINNLYKNFGHTTVLKDINLSIPKGDIFGIIGHSGAGKSTLLRCINGLENFDNGDLTVMNKSLKSLLPSDIRFLRKDIGMIFQGFNLLSRKSVFENVALPLKTWGVPKVEVETKVNKLLEIVGLADKAKVKPSRLSGGQKQRVAIARALALEPKILLCDEATSALDPKTTKDILSLLDDINKTLGITIVIVTHQMEVIKEVCKSVALIEDGALLYSGSVPDLFLKPNKKLDEFLGDDTTNLLTSGVNIKIFFPSTISKDCIITNMARDLNINFSIIGGKLEKFRDTTLGHLIINASTSSKPTITEYLNLNNLEWEVI